MRVQGSPGGPAQANSTLGVPENPPHPEATEGARPARDDTDQDLVALAQGGDERAFANLVQRHEARAFRVARHLVPLDEDARDLVQEAFLRVFRSLDRFDFQYPFATWLHRIVTNLSIDHLRRRRVPLQSTDFEDDEAGRTTLDLPDPWTPPPARRIEAHETAQRVRDCIASLAPHFQSVLVLRELEGLPCTEIARIVGATHVTVRWRLHRGRKLFQEEWERRERLAQAGLGWPGGDSNSSPAPPVEDP